MPLIRRPFLVFACASIVAAARANTPAHTLAYEFKPGQTLRYKLTANIKASVPLFDSPTPVDLDAVITAIYLATPKTLLADGTADVEFKVDAVELTIADVPFPLPVEEIQSVLNQTISISRMGEIKKVTGGGKLPFSVSIPGIDPTRLYSLIFPVVFQPRAVKPGDTWSFTSPLLGGEGAKPAFTASVQKPESSDAESITRIKETLRMEIDQKLDAQNKPVTGDSGDSMIHRTRKGRIEGTGVLHFDRAAGRFTKGTVKMMANIREDLLAEPKDPEEPKSIVSKVDATVTLEYQPEAASAQAGSGKGGR